MQTEFEALAKHQKLFWDLEASPPQKLSLR